MPDFVDRRVARRSRTACGLADRRRHIMKPIEIQPYRLADGTWVFDDARVGLVEEPLIEGTVTDRHYGAIA